MEEKLTYFQVLLGLTREQIKITEEKDVDLKRLDLILQQKETQINKIKRVDHLLNGLGSPQVIKGERVTLAQLIRDLVSLEESSYRNLLSSQLALREELVNYHKRRGLRKLYINQRGTIAYPRFMEREI